MAIRDFISHWLTVVGRAPVLGNDLVRTEYFRTWKKENGEAILAGSLLPEDLIPLWTTGYSTQLRLASTTTNIESNEPYVELTRGSTTVRATVSWSDTWVTTPSSTKITYTDSFSNTIEVVARPNMVDMLFSPVASTLRIDFSHPVEVYGNNAVIDTTEGKFVMLPPLFLDSSSIIQDPPPGLTVSKIADASILYSGLSLGDSCLLSFAPGTIKTDQTINVVTLKQALEAEGQISPRFWEVVGGSVSGDALAAMKWRQPFGPNAGQIPPEANILSASLVSNIYGTGRVAVIEANSMTLPEVSGELPEYWMDFATSGDNWLYGGASWLYAKHMVPTGSGSYDLYVEPSGDPYLRISGDVPVSGDMLDISGDFLHVGYVSGDVSGDIIYPLEDYSAYSNIPPAGDYVIRPGEVKPWDLGGTYYDTVDVAPGSGNLPLVSTNTYHLDITDLVKEKAAQWGASPEINLALISASGYTTNVRGRLPEEGVAPDGVPVSLLVVYDPVPEVTPAQTPPSVSDPASVVEPSGEYIPLVARIVDHHGEAAVGYPVRMYVTKTNDPSGDIVGSLYDPFTGITAAPSSAPLTAKLTTLSDSEGYVRALYTPPTVQETGFTYINLDDSLTQATEDGDPTYVVDASGDPIETTFDIAGDPYPAVSIVGHDHIDYWIRLKPLVRTRVLTRMPTQQGSFVMFSLPRSEYAKHGAIKVQTDGGQSLEEYHIGEGEYIGVSFRVQHLPHGYFVYDHNSNMILVSDGRVDTITAEYEVAPFWKDPYDENKLYVYREYGVSDGDHALKSYGKVDDYLFDPSNVPQSILDTMVYTSDRVPPLDASGDPVDLSLYFDVQVYLWVEFQDPSNSGILLRRSTPIYLESPLSKMEHSLRYARG